jgi:chorismate synthase
MLRFLTSGESHGSCLIAILEGLVAGLKVDMTKLNLELSRRQKGYGRGGRMAIEKDKAEILSGVRFGITIGGPVALRIENKDFKINQLPVVKRPRPGHADLAGALKYNRKDVRDILERASARETAARVAVGALCRQFLNSFGVDILSHVVEIGGVALEKHPTDFKAIRREAEKSELRCVDPETTKRMKQKIDSTKYGKDTIGGVFEVRASGVIPGMGSFVHYDRRLDARLAMALMSIQAVKAVGVGLGFDTARTPGSTAHDEIYYDKTKKNFYRKTNRAGGIEGGMSNGETLVLQVATKPYSTLMKPLRSVHLDDKKTLDGTIERSDVTAVPACGVVGEAMVAFELAKFYLEKFGGDSLDEAKRNFDGYVKQIKSF